MAEEDDLVAYFRALPAPRRREYDALAELDRRFGEDVAAEQATTRGPEPRRDRS